MNTYSSSKGSSGIKSWLIITLTQLITSSTYEKKNLEPENDEKHMANVLLHMSHMLGMRKYTSTLPFAEKVSDKKGQNRPLWQHKIVYSTTLM